MLASRTPPRRRPAKLCRSERRLATRAATTGDSPALPQRPPPEGGRIGAMRRETPAGSRTPPAPASLGIGRRVGNLARR
jgi:hypothetical protein